MYRFWPLSEINKAFNVIQQASVNIASNNLVSSGGLITELPNLGTGGNAFDLDTIGGTAANFKPSPSGSSVSWGASGDYISTPDNASFVPTTEIEVIARVALNDWVTGSFQAIAAQRVGAASNQSFIFYAAPTGGGRLQLSLNGSGGGFGAMSTVAHGFSDRELAWIRANWNLSEDVQRYYTSTDDTDNEEDVNWVQLGTDVAVTGSSLVNSPSPIEIGSRENGTLDLCELNTRRLILRNAIDGANVVDFNAKDAGNTGSTTFVSATTGETWTLNGNTFIQNTREIVAHAIGGVTIEPTSGQTINTPYTALSFFRFSPPTLSADSYICDSKSNASARLGILANDPVDEFAAFAGSTLDSGIAYDTAPHVAIVVNNGDATSSIQIDRNAPVIGDIGAQNFDYCTLFGDNASANTMAGYQKNFLVWNGALSASQRTLLANYYLGNAGL